MTNGIKQEIKTILVSELHLWSENPRDPIELDIGDFEIIKRAIKGNTKKWNISKLIIDMGSYYDFSELPTVVFKDGEYCVYDGNRRIAILKYLQNPTWSYKLESKLFPSSEPEDLKNLLEIPCNVCNEETALTNVERKHITNGSWKQLERDYFEHNFRKKKKSLFLKLEEATGLISKNPELNENIMKNDMLTESKLKDVGFSFDSKDNLISVYGEKLANDILNKIAELRIDKTIGSRAANKYNIKKSLNEVPEFKGIIKKFDKIDSKPVNYQKESSKSSTAIKTKRQNSKKNSLFGGTICLTDGITNDLYRDIVDLYHYYEKNKSNLSNTFPNLIRMALRLLIESTNDYQREDICKYIDSNFDDAKTKLSKDQKATLNANTVTKNNLISLLHTGAHNYSNASNIEQTIAMSLIIGEMLEKTHGRKLK